MSARESKTQTNGVLTSTLSDIQEKYQGFVQHIQTFLQALSDAKDLRSTVIYDPIVRTISQVKSFFEACDHAVKKRTLKMFLDLHQDLARLRTSVEKEASSLLELRKSDSCSDPEFLEFVHMMAEWEAITDQGYDFHQLRAKWPHREINHLSCVQARERYGGVVSLLPVMQDYASTCLKFFQNLQKKGTGLKLVSRFYEQCINNNQVPDLDLEASEIIQNRKSLNTSGKQNQKLADDNQKAMTSPKKSNKLPTNSKKRVEKFLESSGNSLRLTNGKVCSFCKQPEKPKLKKENYSWEPSRVWRGASKGAINHVAHRYCACKNHKETQGPDHAYHAPEIWWIKVGRQLPIEEFGKTV